MTEGPSSQTTLLSPPPAPSTSGDSDSTAQLPPIEKGLDVGVLAELTKTALVESLNEVSLPVLNAPVPADGGDRSKVPKRSFSTRPWLVH